MSGKIFKKYCKNCNKYYEGRGKDFCTIECAYIWRRGKNNHNWKGGRKILDGYIYVRAEGHPSLTKEGYVPLHRLLMEIKINRFLDKKEIVHHLDNNRLNNNIDNLVLCANGKEHLKYHKEKLVGCALGRKKYWENCNHIRNWDVWKNRR